MKKRLLAGLLAFVMVLGLAPLNFVVSVSAAESGTCGDNLTWSHVGGSIYELTISGTGKMYNYGTSATNRPPWYSLSVRTLIMKGGTSVGSYAFYRTVLRNITISKGVTEIGSNAFEGSSYYNNESNWENGVLYIGTNLIKAKPEISGDYEIRPGTTCIADKAFENCTELTSVTIPDSIKGLGSAAFSGCTGLTTVNYTGTVADWCGIHFPSVLSNPAYYGCKVYINGSELAEISEEELNGVTSINQLAFSNFTELSSVTIPDSVKTIGSSAFYGCTGLTSVTIPDSVTSIGNSAFYNCTGLTEINYNAVNAADLTSSSNVFYSAGTAGEGINFTFGDSVEKIPAYLFYVSDSEYTPNIKSITIGNSVTSIGNNAFYNCTGLTEIIYNAVSVSDFSSSSNVFYNAGTASNGINVTFGDSVENIPAYLFYVSASAYKPNIKTITIGNSVTTIGNSAFNNCTGLTEINYNAANAAGLTSSSNVFYNAGTAGEGINVTFGDSVEKIPAYLFYVSDSNYKPNIKSVTIGNSVTSIGNSAFSGCTGLTRVNISDIEAWCEISFSGFYSNPLSFAHHLYLNNTEITDLVIPDSITSIGNYAFYNCTGLTSITIPDSVTSIGEATFRGCTGLTSVTIGNSVTSIGNNAFNNCTGLTSATIGNSVTSIGNNAFYNCTGLTEINYNAVNAADLTSSSTVFYNAGTAGEGINVTFGNSVEKIPVNLFYVSSSSYRPNIKSVTIGNSITSIGNSAFSGFTGLTSVTIGKNVTTIGDSAFKDCTALTHINYNAVSADDLYEQSKIFENAGSAGRRIDVTFGDGVEKIPAYLFYNQPYVKSITLSSSVKTIGRYAFQDSTGLTDIYFYGTEEEWNSVRIRDYNNCLYDSDIHYLEPHVHNYTVSATIPATCAEYGIVTYSCECGASYEEQIEKLPHTPAGTVTENSVTATCTEDGSYDSVVYCTVCGEEISRETAVVPATGHIPSQAVIENNTPATETENGSYDSVVYCSVCGEELSRETVFVSAPSTAAKSSVEIEVEYRSFTQQNTPVILKKPVYILTAYAWLTGIPQDFDISENAGFSWCLDKGNGSQVGLGSSKDFEEHDGRTVNVLTLEIPADEIINWTGSLYAVVTIATANGNYTLRTNTTTLSSKPQAVYAQCVRVAGKTFTDAEGRIYFKEELPEGVSDSGNNYLAPDDEPDGYYYTVRYFTSSDYDMNSRIWIDCDNDWHYIYGTAGTVKEFSAPYRYAEAVKEGDGDGELSTGTNIITGVNARGYNRISYTSTYGTRMTQRIGTPNYSGTISDTANIDVLSLVATVNNDSEAADIEFNPTQGTCGDNLTWNYNSDTTALSISGSGEMTDYESALTVPWTAFNDSITSVIIEKAVTSIGDFAFEGCSALVDTYYFGTPEDWNNISIGSSNEPLVSATRHYYTESSEQPATCVNVGFTACSYWSDTDPVKYIVEPVTIPAIGHTPAKAVKENLVPATAESTGSYDSVVYCSVCGAEISRQTVIIQKTAQNAELLSFVADKNEVVLGSTVTFTVVTSSDINMLRLAVSADGNVAYSVMFSRTAIGNGYADNSDGTATWTLPVTVKYFDLSKDSELQMFAVEYFDATITEYVSFNAEPLTVNVAKYDTSAVVTEVNGEEVEPFSIIMASADLGKKLTYTNITITTTSDVTKLRLTVDGKAVTYSAKTSNVTYTDNSDGTATWVIGYRFTKAGNYEILVESRGSSWEGCSSKTVATTIYNTAAELAAAKS